MSNYKLTYFNGRAIGEPIRLIFKYCGKDFIDERIEMSDWASLKPKTPFGKLPIVEIDGKVLYQSLAICRYLGEEFGLAGENNWENLQINMIGETLQDIKNLMSHYYRQMDEKAQEKKKPELINETLPFYLERFDKIIQNNGGYLANGKLSWVDFYFAGYSETFEGMLGVKLCENYTNVSQLRKKIYSLPKVKEWIATRPITLV